MNKVYDMAMTAITSIAETMKKGGKAGKSGAAGVLLLLMLLTAAPAGAAVTKAEADSAYTKEQYQQAAELYEQLLKRGVSADLYYNLGNCYYRMDNITLAVLNYERALQLSPGDRDVRFNLQMARSKTIDKITPESEMFFVTWYRSLVSLQSVDAWAQCALIALVLAIVLALAYLFAEPVWLRKVGFFGGAVFVVVFLASNLFAWQQRRGLLHRTGAVIIKSAVPVKSTPATNGTDLFILHEGTRVDITDGSMRQWKQVRVADGKEGWVEVSQIVVI